jgi:molecular chaperone HscC
MALCGIDLGTTNSLIAVLQDTGPKLIPNALGELLTPSVVGLSEDGTILVGRAAKERLITHPDTTAASFKRYMGSGHKTSFGKLAFRPEELSAFVLRSLKADAEAFLNAPLDEAVISVPAYFNDHQRKATIDAAKLAGLKVERLVNEPTAAALAYGFGDVAEGKYLVFDLGGGTFDVSILDKYEGIMEIRATTGDTRLGGDDFTEIIEVLIARAAGFELKTLGTEERARLVRAAETLKVALSTAHEATFALTLAKSETRGQITRLAYEVECASLLRRLRSPTERALVDANMKPTDFDAVVLVGGATRMPMVRSLVGRLFGRLPLINIDPDTIVAMGAAVQSGLVARAGGLKDIVMTDVSPYTLGVAATDKRVEGPTESYVATVIQRNAVVPISRSIQLVTAGDNQSFITVEVYQGENLRPESNVHLGSIRMPVPRGPEGKEGIDVRFTYDINGALEVEVEVLSTKLRDRKIFRNASGLSEAELEARFSALSAIKLHPRDLMENKTLIARAERLYSEQTERGRESLRGMIGQFEAVISSQSQRDLNPVRNEFSKFLDTLEYSPFDNV